MPSSPLQHPDVILLPSTPSFSAPFAPNGYRAQDREILCCVLLLVWFGLNLSRSKRENHCCFHRRDGACCWFMIVACGGFTVLVGGGFSSTSWWFRHCFTVLGFLRVAIVVVTMVPTKAALGGECNVLVIDEWERWGQKDNVGKGGIEEKKCKNLGLWLKKQYI